MEIGEVILDQEYPDRKVLVGSDAPDSVRPNLQKRRKFASERNEIINKEVDKLLDMGMIREVIYPDWLANVTDLEWTMFIDGAANMRGTGLGVVLKSPQGDKIEQAISCAFEATNNEAEYETLITGLKVCIDLGVQNLKVY
ncbi:uncharacterized protein LOC141658084 [Silene latifolia]|uniref:uncharacterized protein LOC141658084 n=1 Tax=Silene latifolia TaxID=37657 RepID=UPI003D77B056